MGLQKKQYRAEEIYKELQNGNGRGITLSLDYLDRISYNQLQIEKLKKTANSIKHIQREI